MVVYSKIENELPLLSVLLLINGISILLQIICILFVQSTFTFVNYISFQMAENKWQIPMPSHDGEGVIVGYLQSNGCIYLSSEKHAVCRIILVAAIQKLIRLWKCDGYIIAVLKCVLFQTCRLRNDLYFAAGLCVKLYSLTHCFKSRHMLTL